MLSVSIINLALIIILFSPSLVQAEDCSRKITEIIKMLNLNIPISNQDIGLEFCNPSGESPYITHTLSEENDLFNYSSIFSLKTNYPQCDQDLQVILEGREEKFVPDCYGKIALNEEVPFRLPVFQVIVKTSKKEMVYEKTIWGWAMHHDGGSIANKIPTSVKY